MVEDFQNMRGIQKKSEGSEVFRDGIFFFSLLQSGKKPRTLTCHVFIDSLL